MIFLQFKFLLNAYFAFSEMRLVLWPWFSSPCLRMCAVNVGLIWCIRVFSLLVETSKFYPCLRFVQGYLEVDVSLEVFAPLSLFCCLFHYVEVNALNCWMLAFTVCLCPYNEKMMLRSFIWFYFFCLCWWWCILYFASSILFRISCVILVVVYNLHCLHFIHSCCVNMYG